MGMCFFDDDDDHMHLAMLIDGRFSRLVSMRSLVGGYWL